MPSATDAHPFTNNWLLARLPPADYKRLRPLLKAVRFTKGQIIYDVADVVNYAYFLTSGMVSLLAIIDDEQIVQVAMVGYEGLLGIPALLRTNLMPYRVTSQLPTTALRINAVALNAEFNRGGALTDLLLRYLHTLITQITQSAVCHRYHTVEARLCRWLLLSRDRAHTDRLPLTQETLAYMLGVKRTSVSSAASLLQSKGLITYRWGHLQLLDRAGLEASACICYRIISAELAQFFAA
jgi:CRP-like cAMP-binding protein